MAKPIDTLIEDADTDAAIVGEIAVPDEPSLGWSPVESLYIHVEDHEAVGEVYASDAGSEEDPTAIEFIMADLTADNVLVDLENEALEIFDLNDLLEQPDAPEDAMSLISVDSGMVSDVAETDSLEDSTPSAIDQLPMNMTFSQLTIVIDDDSNPDIVAL